MEWDSVAMGSKLPCWERLLPNGYRNGSLPGRNGNIETQHWEAGSVTPKLECLMLKPSLENREMVENQGKHVE